MPTIIEDFESSLDSTEWTDQTNVSRNTTYAYNGSYSLIATDGSNPLGRFEPSELSGGEEIDYFEFYWYETNDQFGGALTVEDSNNNRIAGFATDNPQWTVRDGGSWTQVYDPGDYNDWTRVRITFDYPNNQITYDIEDMADGDTFSGTYPMENSASDVENIQIREFTGGSFGSSDTQMWFDDFTVEGLSSGTTTSADVSLNNISQVQIDGADFEGQVDSQNDATDADLGFDVFNASTGNLVSSIIAESNVDLTQKTLPYIFTDDIDTLSSSTSYDVQSFADTSGGKFTSAQQGFTTEDVKTLDYTGGFETFTTASSGNIRKEISFDLNVSTASAPNTSFDSQIITDIISSIENGTTSDLKNGVVLDNGTILHEDDLVENVGANRIDAAFSVTELQSSDTDTITDFQIEDNNGNVYWQSQQSIKGGQDIILRVSFVGR